MESSPGVLSTLAKLDAPALAVRDDPCVCSSAVCRFERSGVGLLLIIIASSFRPRHRPRRPPMEAGISKHPCTPHSRTTFKFFLHPLPPTGQTQPPHRGA